MSQTNSNLESKYEALKFQYAQLKADATVTNSLLQQARKETFSVKQEYEAEILQLKSLLRDSLTRNVVSTSSGKLTFSSKTSSSSKQVEQLSSRKNNIDSSDDGEILEDEDSDGEIIEEPTSKPLVAKKRSSVAISSSSNVKKAKVSQKNNAVLKREVILQLSNNQNTRVMLMEPLKRSSSSSKNNHIQQTDFGSKKSLYLNLENVPTTLSLDSTNSKGDSREHTCRIRALLAKNIGHILNVEVLPFSSSVAPSHNNTNGNQGSLLAKDKYEFELALSKHYKNKNSKFFLSNYFEMKDGQQNQMMIMCVPRRCPLFPHLVNQFVNSSQDVVSQWSALLYIVDMSSFYNALTSFDFSQAYRGLPHQDSLNKSEDQRLNHFKNEAGQLLKDAVKEKKQKKKNESAELRREATTSTTTNVQSNNIMGSNNDLAAMVSEQQQPQNVPPVMNDPRFPKPPPGLLPLPGTALPPPHPDFPLPPPGILPPPPLNNQIGQIPTMTKPPTTGPPKIIDILVEECLVPIPPVEFDHEGRPIGNIERIRRDQVPGGTYKILVFLRRDVASDVKAVIVGVNGSTIQLLNLVLGCKINFEEVSVILLQSPRKPVIESALMALEYLIETVIKIPKPQRLDYIRKCLETNFRLSVPIVTDEQKLNPPYGNEFPLNHTGVQLLPEEATMLTKSASVKYIARIVLSGDAEKIKKIIGRIFSSQEIKNFQVPNIFNLSVSYKESTISVFGPSKDIIVSSVATTQSLIQSLARLPPGQGQGKEIKRHVNNFLICVKEDLGYQSAPNPLVYYAGK